MKQTSQCVGAHTTALGDAGSEMPVPTHGAEAADPIEGPAWMTKLTGDMLPKEKTIFGKVTEKLKCEFPLKDMGVVFLEIKPLLKLV